MSQAKIILVAGPTASGKSAFALDLAQKRGGAILNADALQIYAGLPLLSAQPDDHDRRIVPHRLYGTVAPDQRSSAGNWVTLAKAAIDEIRAGGLTPILVGGTGLYFRALLGGLADIPPIPDEVRARVQDMYDEMGEEKFRAELARRDAESAARLARNDRQRSIRAFEVVLHTGHPLGYWHKQSTADTPYDVEAHLLMPERDKLYAACDARFIKMMERGALEEAREFGKRELAPTLPVMKTLGLRELLAHLNGEISLDNAIAKAQQATRNYAKRQTTWFRNQWPYST